MYKVLVSITDELQSRKQILRTAGVANIDEYNRNAEKKLYRIVFACDEIAEVLDKTGLSKQQKDEILKIESELSIIARQGRALEFTLFLQHKDLMPQSSTVRYGITLIREYAVGRIMCCRRLFLTIRMLQIKLQNLHRDGF